ncbi:interferon gamma receptor 1-like [Sceloporus undulatus]|uniref:interferon gamma receptor 1-like n=1 Tax=Sceloporus undulatus TaxID=8520 RepID=UPI001C4CDCF2|nr:interferon gamma receptor 1-like [Sceloporus undulatus]
MALIIFFFVSVPQPTNVIIESFNFNTSVQWDYKSLSSEPLFVVELLCYGFSSGVYLEFSSCVNISQHYCDLTHKVEQCVSFWVRVKALAGPQESEYTESQQFNIYRNGQIGPPKLNLYVLGHGIQVDIEHPLTPYRKKRTLSIKANFTDFTYKVSFWKKGNQEEHQEFETERCNHKNCTINFHIPLWDTSYCVSAHGISEDYSVKGEESKESCIDVLSKHQSDLTVPIILGIIGLFVLMVILTIIFICMKKKNIKLPKSLAAVVRNQVNNIDTNSEPRIFSFITSSSDKQVLSECDDKKSLEQVYFMSEVNTTDFSNCGTEVDPYGSQGALSKTGEESIMESMPESMIVGIPEGEQNSADNGNYFKSVSDPEEMDNTFENVDFAKANLQPPMCCRNISGYDKPHWKDSVSEVDSLIT